jgi:hypothetical protein
MRSEGIVAIPSNYAELAYRFAPINYQHVNQDNRRRDMLCAINFDGDWNTSNNRANIGKYDLIPVVYYAIAETDTHYFLLYCFYHADDLTHENDLEGCLVIVESKTKKLLGMITVAHFDFYSYAVENRLQGRNDLDGKLYFDTIDGNEHPLVCQEMNKHGCYAWKGTPRWMFWNRCFEWRCRRCRPWWMFWGRKDSDNCFGIRYCPVKEAIMPDEKDIRSFKETSYGYVLVDILGPEGFYSRRDPELHPETFKAWGVFDSTTPGSANAPWIWDDLDIWSDSEDNFEAGTIFKNPAVIVSKYFDGFAEFSTHYKKYMYK